MKHLIVMAIVAGSVSLTAGAANAQYRAPLKPVTTLTSKPAVGGVKLAPNANIGAARINPAVGGRLIGNDGAGIVASGGGNFRR